MAALADQRSAALLTPDAINRRVGAVVGLLGGHAQDLRLGLVEYLTLALDRRRVDDLCRVSKNDAAGGDQVADTPHLSGYRREHLVLRILFRRSEESAEGLLHNHVLARADSSPNIRQMRRRRCANIQHVNIGQHRLYRFIRTDAELPGEGLAALLPCRGDSHRHRAQALQIPMMELTGEARAGDTDSKGIGHVRGYLDSMAKRCFLPRIKSMPSDIGGV